MIELNFVKDRLASLGYPAKDEDTELLIFEIDKWIKYSLSFMNREEMPEEVEPKVIDKICYEFLTLKKNNGTLEGFDYGTGISELKEGDTTIKYNSDGGQSASEKRFQNIMDALDTRLKSWLVEYRQLKW